MAITTPPLPNASLVDWAHWYALHLGPVFPCRGKKPLTTHGFQDATLDPFQLDIWWRQWPDANIALALGRGLWVLDVDPRNGGDTTLRNLEQQYEKLPDTLTSLTGGGGVHYPWLLPADGVQHKANLGDGLDVIGLGGYVILPPSIHPDTGKSYLWDVVYGLEECPLQHAPAWLEALVSPQHANGAGLRKAVAGPGERIPEGRRESTLVRLAGAMRATGATVDEIYAALDAMNQRCDPALTDADLTRIARSIGRYVPNPTMDIGPQAQPAPLGPQVAPAAAPTTAPQGTGWGTPPPRFQTISAPDLYAKQLPAQEWIVPDILPAGATLFAGRGKDGKSLLAWNLCVAVATGGQGLGHYPVTQGDVLYCALEDGERRAQARLQEQLEHMGHGGSGCREPFMQNFR